VSVCVYLQVADEALEDEGHVGQLGVVQRAAAAPDQPQRAPQRVLQVPGNIYIYIYIAAGLSPARRRSAH
jgi:hypothetical protein